jgi:hypothetical protein
MVLVDDFESGSCALALVLVAALAFIVLSVVAFVVGAVLGLLTSSGLL